MMLPARSEQADHQNVDRYPSPPGELRCDSAIHIYDVSRPTVPTATFLPPHAPLSSYRLVQQQLHLSRVVLSQPTAYGFDNDLMLNNLQKLGAHGKGIAVVPPSISEIKLADLHEKGIRAVRFMMFAGGVLGWEAAGPLAERIRDLGWHLKFQLDGTRFEEYQAFLGALPIHSTIDFYPTTFPSNLCVSSPSIVAVRRLLQKGRIWVALSAPYSDGDWDDCDSAQFEIVRTLVRDNPDQCVWASNWPHVPLEKPPPTVNAMDWLCHCVDEEALQHKILVENPARLFGFQT